MQTVTTIPEAKGNGVWSVGPNDSVYSALEPMAQRNVGAVLVLEEHKPVGVLSERDYARGVVLEGRVSKTTPVAAIMSRSVVYVRPTDTVEDCMALMTEKRLRHLPVVERDRVIGLISIGDVVKAVVSKPTHEIRELRNCITGFDPLHHL